MQKAPARFNGEILTEATIIATRQHFADIYQAVIDKTLSGEHAPASHVDIQGYIAQYKEKQRAMLAGESEDNFTFLQRAYWLQTGDCVALLP